MTTSFPGATLSTKVAGALVTQNSGTPGGGTSVRIDERRFGRIAEARTAWLPYPAQETVGNPNPQTTP